MHSNHLLLITLLGISGSASAAEKQCLPPVEPIRNANLAKNKEIIVQADAAQMRQNTYAEFTGRVEISSQNAQIKAESAKVDKETQKLEATGNIQFQNNDIKVNSDDLVLDMESRQVELNNTSYRMIAFQGRGNAKNIDLSQQDGVTLNDVSFSTCPEGNEDWRIEASSIEVKAGDLWGTTKHTKFYVGGVPVLYLPYFKFPVTEQRQSGLLFPEISSSERTGVTYEQPIYWNIAPNFDATISPRLMSSRGLQLKNELRYLTESHRGEFHFEYMPDDSEFESDDTRYFYRLNHYGELSDRWTMNVELNGISDDNYIVDLGSDFFNRADTHLFQTVGFNYFSQDLTVSASFRDFELIGDHPNSYRALPEIIADYNIWETDFLSFKVNTQLAYFENGEATDPTATRLHIAPTVALPYYTPWGEFLAEASLLHTNYNQSQIEGTDLSKSVSRTLGQGRLYGSVAFERDSRWFNQDFTQTLEPKVQYLYTGYQDQSDIGLYDTIRIRNDFEGLFRAQEFSGLDRISDQNQLTLGVTSRLIDKNSREQFRLSLGQIFYFEESQLLESTRGDNRSALAAELDWSISSKWFLQGEIEVSSEDRRNERSNFSVEYRLSDSKLVQLNHRYVRDISGEKIDQIGLVASWDIADKWKWVGRYYRDLDLHRSTESYTGVQYESCCWSVQLVWQRYLSNRFDALGNQGIDEYESGISLKFSFNGLGRGRNSRSLLDDGLFGYTRPYLLTN